DPEVLDITCRNLFTSDILVCILVPDLDIDGGVNDVECNTHVCSIPVVPVTSPVHEVSRGNIEACRIAYRYYVVWRVGGGSGPWCKPCDLGVTHYGCSYVQAFFPDEHLSPLCNLVHCC